MTQRLYFVGILKTMNRIEWKQQTLESLKCHSYYQVSWCWIACVNKFIEYEKVLSINSRLQLYTSDVWNELNGEFVRLL